MALNPAAQAISYATDINEQFPGLCDRFVGRCYGLRHSGYKSANAHWEAIPAEFKNSGTDAPVGSLVFFDTGKKWGHVGIVTGRSKNGEPIVTTTHLNNGTPTEVPLSRMGSMKFRGWTTPYFHGKTADLSKLDVNRGAQAVTPGMDTMYAQTDKLKMKDLRRDFGIAAGVLDEFPELKKTLKEIISMGVTDPGRQLAMLRETDWFQKHTQQWMDVEKARLEKDPRIWASLVDQRAEEIRIAYEQAGAAVPSDDDLDSMAENLMRGSGWDGKSFEIYDDKWLRGRIARAIDFSKTKMIDGVQVADLTGAAGDLATKLYDTAYQFGVDSSMSNTVFKDWFGKTMTGLIDGSMAEEQIDDELRNMAMSRFPGLSQQIQRGLTVRQAADPYLTALGSALEMDPSTLGLDDNLVQQVLNTTDETGQFKPMSIYDTKLLARKDERWQYTGQAKQEYTDMASKILRDFGFLG
jgi:hypothetical protein